MKAKRMTSPANPLIVQARSGDQAAMQQLFCKHFDRLHQHIQFRLGREAPDELHSEDVLQEAFVHAVRDMQKCQATTDASFLAWLKGIADNRFRDALKRKQTQKRGGDRNRIIAVRTDDASSLKPLVDLLCDSVDTPSVDAAAGEAIKAIQAGLATLPDDQRVAVSLRYIEGRSIEEVAAHMERTPAAVRGLLHRGKLVLKEAMGSSARWFSKKP